MSMKQEVAISPVGTVEYMAPEVNSIWQVLTLNPELLLRTKAPSMALDGFTLS